jgi:hypothetical protein
MRNKKLSSIKSMLSCLQKTFFLSRQVGVRPENEHDGYRVRLAGKHDLPECLEVYTKLHGGAGLGNFKKLMYKLSGGKVIVVAVRVEEASGTSEIVGVDMYYVNERDARENTVHEGFIGVLPKAEGNGLATQMRSFASSIFQDAGLDGISTRISEDNIASMKSAKNQGFEVVERYFDEAQGKFRCYMKKTF